MLRQLLFLQDNVPRCAIYIILGILPVQAIIHKKMCVLFGTIGRKVNSVEWKIAERQLAIKSKESASWFVSIKRILAIYELQSPLVIFSEPYTKQRWNELVNRAVTQYWQDKVEREAAKLNSLRLLNTS